MGLETWWCGISVKEWIEVGGDEDGYGNFCFSVLCLHSIFNLLLEWSGCDYESPIMEEEIKKTRETITRRRRQDRTFGFLLERRRSHRRGERIGPTTNATAVGERADWGPERARK